MQNIWSNIEICPTSKLCEHVRYLQQEQLTPLLYDPSHIPLVYVCISIKLKSHICLFGDNYEPVFKMEHS